MKKLTALLLALLMLVSLCACGRSAHDANGAVVAPAAAQSSYAAYDAGPYEYAEAEESAAGFAMNAKAAGAPAEPREEDAPDENPEKIIYSSDVTVETTDFDGALAKLSALVESSGGWVESSSVNGSNFYSKSRGYASTRSANYCLRVPSDRFDTLMNSLSDLGNIPYTHTYTENVSAQYYDTEAHLKAYQTQEARLLEMMEVAETVEDIVTLEDRLTELRYRIESLQSTLKNWDRRVSYSTIYLEIQEVQEYTPETVVRLSYGQRLWRSLKDGLKGVAEFFEDLLLWLVGALPALLILAVLFFLLRPVVKKAVARRREKKLQKRAPAKAETKPAE